MFIYIHMEVKKNQDRTQEVETLHDVVVCRQDHLIEECINKPSAVIKVNQEGRIGINEQYERLYLKFSVM